MNSRKANFSGQFYPNSKKEIKSLLKKIKEKEKNNIKYELNKKNILGGIVPHAGYKFSGYEAIHFFELIKNKNYDTVIIINPNHTGLGKEISLSDYNTWSTPMGKVELDHEFISNLDFPISNIAHDQEHSGEVILPFLQNYLENNFNIVPITFSNQNLINAKKIAKKIYEVNNILKRKLLIIASSDFTHYESPEKGKELDNMVLKDILNFNSEQIFKKVKDNNLTICGFGPILVLLEYSKFLSEKVKLDLLKRGHSGEVIPSKKVVDYLSFILYET